MYSGRVLVCCSMLFLGLLSGCTSQQQRANQVLQEQQKQQIVVQNSNAQAAIQQCSVQYPTEQRSKENAVPFATCILAATQKFNNPSDLALALAYKRLQLAEAFAAGKITKTEYASLFQDYIAQVKAIQMQRESAARAARAAESAAETNAQLARCLAARQRSADQDASYYRNPPTTGFGELGSKPNKSVANRIGC